MYKYSYLVACVLMCVSATLMLMLVDSDHNWGGDFSQYLAQAQSIINHTIPQQIANNTLMMEYSDAHYGPNVYPWGYPLLLAPIVAIFGWNLIALKCINIAFFALFIGSFYLYASRRMHPLASTILTLVFALNPMLLTFASNNILSDISYMCVSFIAVVTLQALFTTNTTYNDSLRGGA